MIKTNTKKDMKCNLEKQILELIKIEPVNIIKILSKLRIDNPTISESIVRQKVWALVDRGVSMFVE